MAQSGHNPWPRQATIPFAQVRIDRLFAAIASIIFIGEGCEPPGANRTSSRSKTPLLPPTVFPFLD
jgi:hypothetical protein